MKIGKYLKITTIFLTTITIACATQHNAKRGLSKSQIEAIRKRSNREFNDLNQIEKGGSLIENKEVKNNNLKEEEALEQINKEEEESLTAEKIETDVHKKRPDWVESQPRKSGYILGVGMAEVYTSEKDGWEQAKNSALKEIAQQLEVTVNGVLKTMIEESTIEKNEQKTSYFSQSTKEAIESFVTRRLKEIEILDRYREGNNYYILMGYNIEKVKKRIREKLHDARDRALTAFNKAILARKRGKLNIALRELTKAYSAMLDYFGMDIEGVVEGFSGTHRINDDIVRMIEELITACKFEADRSQYNGMLKGGTKEDINIIARCKEGDPEGLVLRETFVKGAGRVIKQTVINNKGYGSLKLDKLFGSGKVILKVGLDIKSISPPGYGNALYTRFSNIIDQNAALINIAIPSTKIFIRIVEKNLDRPLNQSIFAESFKSVLSKIADVTFTSSKDEANFIAKGLAETGDCKPFYQSKRCRADVTLVLVDNETNEEFLSFHISTVGLSPDGDEAAGLDALEKLGRLAAKRLKEKLLR